MRSLIPWGRIFRTTYGWPPVVRWLLKGVCLSPNQEDESRRPSCFAHVGKPVCSDGIPKSSGSDTGPLSVSCGMKPSDSGSQVVTR